jgi:phosphonate transport system ATP-binding protein
MLIVEGLRKQFGRTTAVDDCSIAIPNGQLVGVIGRSGAGKSTLLRLINRLIEPSAGKILLGEREVSGLKGAALRQWRVECAMIFQQFNLVPRLDVLTNVLVGRIGHRPVLPTMFKHFPRDERAIAAKVLDRLDLLPQALQRADTLSGGQQQRVAIARALAQEPTVILADEPVASLDPANAKRVLEALTQINREDGITVICNIHDLNAARATFERIIGMRSGRIVFDGPPSALDQAATDAIYGGREGSEMVPARAFPVRDYAGAPTSLGLDPAAAAV